MEKITKAIEFAANAHDGMVRKKDGSPYIMHPLEAATIVASMTADTDVIIAALLHDVVEDAGITSEEIKAEFGERVAALVASETENKREHISPDKTWKIRKEESLEGLKNSTDRDVLIVWLGDKLSNMRSFYRIKKVEGDSMWLSFNQNNPEEQRWYYSSIAELTSELRDFPAWKEYNELVKMVFRKENEENEN